MKPKKNKAVLEKLQASFGEVSFSNKTGEYIVRQGFYYRQGRNEETLANKVLALFPQAAITKKWERYGAWPTRSFWEVRFTVPEVTKDNLTA